MKFNIKVGMNLFFRYRGVKVSEGKILLPLSFLDISLDFSHVFYFYTDEIFSPDRTASIGSTTRSLITGNKKRIHRKSIRSELSTFYSFKIKLDPEIYRRIATINIKEMISNLEIKSKLRVFSKEEKERERESGKLKSSLKRIFSFFSGNWIFHVIPFSRFSVGTRAGVPEGRKKKKKKKENEARDARGSSWHGEERFLIPPGFRK